MGMDDKRRNTRNQLLKQFPRDQWGVWQIFGEDPNCGLGGYHHEPYLDTVECDYATAVAYAMGLNGFFQWGTGGSIRLAPTPKKLDAEAVKRRKELLEEHEQLTQRLAQIKKELE